MAYTVPPITLRLVQGSPLTFDQEDSNWIVLRDFCNVIGQIFNPDGTLDPTLLQSTILNYLASAFIGQTASYLQPVGALLWMPKPLAVGVASNDNGANWLEMDGTKRNQSDFPSLFNFIGQDFRTLDSATAPDSIGGAVNLATEFRLPNAQNRTLFCRGTNQANWPAETIIGQDGRDTNAIGQNNLTLVTQIPLHNHHYHDDNANTDNAILCVFGSGTGGGAGIQQSISNRTANSGSNTGPNAGGAPFSVTPPGLVGVGYVLAGYKVNGAWI